MHLSSIGSVHRRARLVGAPTALACLFALVILAAAALPVVAQTGEFKDEFDGTSLDTTKWTPFALTYSHAGQVSVSDGSLSITHDPNDPRVGESRFGILSNVVFGTQATVEAALESFEGNNAILRLQGRNGAFVELGLDSNPDTPLHVWRSYPDDDKGWNGGAGAAAPITLGIARNGDSLEVYTVSGGQKTTRATVPVAGLGDAFRVILYGYAGSNTVWNSFSGTGALPMGTLTGTVTGPGAAGARVSVGDTLFQPVIADASGKFSLPLLPGSYTVTASALGANPAQATATVAAGQTADVSLALTSAPEAPIYDHFEGSALDTTKWTPVTVEGQGMPQITIADSELIVEGSTIQSWRRNGLMSNTAFDARNSVMRFKLDPNPGDAPWHPFIALWDGAGTPNWNTQPHVEVELRRDLNRLQLDGGRAPWVSREADQMMFAPLDTTDLPIVVTIVRTGNTFDFYTRTQSQTADQLAFTTTTSNLGSNHRVVIYTFTPEPNAANFNTTTWDYVAASNPVTTGTLSGRVTAGGNPLPNAGVLITGGGNALTARTDAQGSYSLPLSPGDYTVTAVAHGYDRAAPQAVTLASGASQTVDLSLTASSLFPPPVYDDFSGAELDMSRWKITTEEGTGQGNASLSDGNLLLEGPGPGNRWGVMSTAKFPAAASVAEAVVDSVENFGPGGLNAILQLYTGDGGFNHFIEFGIETLHESGVPMLHVWGPESGDFHGPAPSDFPLTLTTVRHGDSLDFFANGQWFHSVNSKRLEGDHSVFLYGYGSSVARFASLAAGGQTAQKKGDVNADDKVNIVDAILVLRFSVGMVTPTEAQKAAADVNGDQKTNVQDVILILRFLVGLIDQLPA